MTLQFKTQHLKHKLDVSKQLQEQKQTIEQNQLLDPIIDQVDQEMIEDAELSPIKQYLKRIEDLIAKQDIPIATLRSSCNTVMLELAKHQDSILELEPKEISLIVEGYIKVADEETRGILENKSKASSRKKTNKTTSNLAFKFKEVDKISQEIQDGKIDNNNTTEEKLDLNFL